MTAGTVTGRTRLARSAMPRGRRLVKRTMDLLFAAVLLALTLPVLLAAGLAVRLTSPGPAFFRQQRVGYLGSTFVMFKFRSMYVGGDDSAHRAYVSRLLTEDHPPPMGSRGVYKPDHSSRTTPVGRFLRRTSLDELPQLLNVLRGDMSLVGPRPAIPYEEAMFDPVHRRRTSVPPGMTGLWQVRGRSTMTMRQALDLDVEYVDRQSLWLDLTILALTVPTVLFGIGAE